MLKASSHPDTTNPTSSGPVLRPGDHTVLFLEDNHMRITVPVISIDTGRIGNEVRVSSLDRKITFRGVVIADGAVRGDLP